MAHNSLIVAHKFKRGRDPTFRGETSGTKDTDCLAVPCTTGKDYKLYWLQTKHKKNRCKKGCTRKILDEMQLYKSF